MDASFCSECGNELTAATTVRGTGAAPSSHVDVPSARSAPTCPSCGAVRNDDAPFCRTCGEAFELVQPLIDDGSTRRSEPTMPNIATSRPTSASEPTSVLPVAATTIGPTYERVAYDEVPQRGGTLLNRALIALLAFAVVLVMAGGVLLFLGLDDDPESTTTGTLEPSATVEATTLPATTAATASSTTAANPTTTDALTTTTPSGGDLGLATPMQRPACDGAHITIVGSAVDPSRYAETVQATLDAYPDSNYTVTTTCPSLNQDLDGNNIYVVYFGPYASTPDACDARFLVGGPDSYVRTLSETLPPTHVVGC